MLDCYLGLQGLSGLPPVERLSMGGLLGFSYDLIHNQFLKLTSAVTMSVVGNAKLVVLIAISMATLERTPTVTKGYEVSPRRGMDQRSEAGSCWEGRHNTRL